MRNAVPFRHGVFTSRRGSVLLTFEPRDHDDAHPMSGGERGAECMFCTFLVSEDSDREKWNCRSVCFEWSHPL